MNFFLQISIISYQFSLIWKKRVRFAAPTAPSATMAMDEFVYHRLDRIINARTMIRSFAARMLSVSKGQIHRPNVTAVLAIPVRAMAGVAVLHKFLSLARSNVSIMAFVRIE